jgi:hypothetical protein
VVFGEIQTTQNGTRCKRGNDESGEMACSVTMGSDTSTEEQTRTSRSGAEYAEEGAWMKVALCGYCDHTITAHRLESGFYDVRSGRAECDVVGCPCKSYR